MIKKDDGLIFKKSRNMLRLDVIMMNREGKRKLSDVLTILVDAEYRRQNKKK